MDVTIEPLARKTKLNLYCQHVKNNLLIVIVFANISKLVEWVH